MEQAPKTPPFAIVLVRNPLGCHAGLDGGCGARPDSPWRGDATFVGTEYERCFG